jgi:hypothetical protein
MSTPTLARPVALDRGDVLRIRDGGGLTLRPESGVLWVTEEKHGDDRVIAPGDVCRLEGMGLALVYAHRASRVVIDARGLDRVPDVRIAAHGADASRPVRLARGKAAGLAHAVVAAWRVLRRALARARTGAVADERLLEHDLYYSSRRRRGVAERFDVVPRDPLHRAFLPYY